MAKYSRSALEQASAAGTRIGSWHGFGVYTCSKYDYDATSKDYWVLYDDNNKLIHKGFCEGFISEKGNVTDCDKYWYNVPRKQKEKVTKTVPASGYSAEVIADEFFSRIDREINELLAGINEVDLLAGLSEIN